MSRIILPVKRERVKGERFEVKGMRSEEQRGTR
jgi:hypothetical protein